MASDALAVRPRRSALGRLDVTLRHLVNSVLQGYDAYATIKLAVALMCLSKLSKALKSAWMHRAVGLSGLYEWFVSIVAPLAKKLPMVQKLSLIHI